MVASDIWDVGEWFESTNLKFKVNKGQFFGYFLCWPRLNITNILDIEIKVNKKY